VAVVSTVMPSSGGDHRVARVFVWNQYGRPDVVSIAFAQTPRSSACWTGRFQRERPSAL